MNIIMHCELGKESIISKVCEFLNLEKVSLENISLKSAIKKMCVVKLCQIIGLTGNYNYKSDFFDFFSSIMGEAICEKLAIKINIASDELRLVKYEKINLVTQVKEYLERDCVEEAFLDAFELVDKFKYLIPKLKKFSKN